MYETGHWAESPLTDPHFALGIERKTSPLAKVLTGLAVIGTLGITAYFGKQAYNNHQAKQLHNQELQAKREERIRQEDEFGTAIAQLLEDCEPSRKLTSTIYYSMPTISNRAPGHRKSIRNALCLSNTSKYPDTTLAQFRLYTRLIRDTDSSITQDPERLKQTMPDNGSMREIIAAAIYTRAIKGTPINEYQKQVTIAVESYIHMHQKCMKDKLNQKHQKEQAIKQCAITALEELIQNKQTSTTSPPIE